MNDLESIAAGDSVLIHGLSIRTGKVISSTPAALCVDDPQKDRIRIFNRFTSWEQNAAGETISAVYITPTPTYTEAKR